MGSLDHLNDTNWHLGVLQARCYDEATRRERKPGAPVNFPISADEVAARPRGLPPLRSADRLVSTCSMDLALSVNFSISADEVAARPQGLLPRDQKTD